MKKNILSFAAVAVLSLGFTACGGGSSSNNETSTTNIEVERGKIYDATVKDSSTPAKIATMTVGSNIYKFSSTPTYPVIATGGWIDVDADGAMTVADIKNDLNLTSYSNVITPTTSYLGDITTVEGKARLDQLVSSVNVSKEELVKVPSKAKANAMLVANSIYQKVKQNGDFNISAVSFSDINTTFHNLDNLLITYSNKSGEELAKAIENQVVNTNLTGQVTKLDATMMSDIIEKRKKSTTVTSSNNSTFTISSNTKALYIYSNTSLSLNEIKSSAISDYSTYHTYASVKEYSNSTKCSDISGAINISQEDEILSGELSSGYAINGSIVCTQTTYISGNDKGTNSYIIEFTK